MTILIVSDAYIIMKSAGDNGGA